MTAWGSDNFRVFFCSAVFLLPLEVAGLKPASVCLVLSAYMVLISIIPGLSAQQAPKFCPQTIILN